MVHEEPTGAGSEQVRGRQASRDDGGRPAAPGGVAEGEGPAGPGGVAEGEQRPQVGGEDPTELAGVSDGFERLWTPHRMVYINGERPTDDPGAGCPFCVAPDKDDAQGLIVHRGDRCYVVMNLFPYNPGHVLVCPYRHVSLYVDLDDEETREFTALTKAALGALDAASAPHGYNIGMNQGAVAGAGVAAHLHQHIVPRWGGDSNFLPVIGQTKALPMLLEDTRRQLVDAWPTGD